MIKKVLLLSLVGVFLTGCIVAPYDDYPDRYQQRHDHQHRDHSDDRWDRNGRRWEYKRDDDRYDHDHRDWNKDRRDRQD